MIGASFNQYRIIGSLGAGGMGEVFRARDIRLNREVAIKVLPKDFAGETDRFRRFEQESKTLAALNHPNILTIHDAGVQDGTPFLVSELLEGKTLREELKGGALPLRKAADYALQIAHGLAAAHGKGIIHRDLKPENIFITKDGRVKILDFGLAKLQPDLKSRMSDSKSEADPNAPTLADSTQPGMVMGTPTYMSPEQVRGEPADHRSDIFAFGCVLYEMLTGERAFRGDTLVETMNAVLREDPTTTGANRIEIPSALERVVFRCLEKQPDDRFQSAKDLAFAIENAGTTSTAFSRAEPSKASQAVFIRGRLLPWAVAAICLAGLLFVILQHKSPPKTAADLGQNKVLRKFDLMLPAPTHDAPSLEPYLAISPDGKKFAYANPDGLLVCRLDQITTPLLLVAGRHIKAPFWSPQSTEIGYFDDRQLYRIPATGGSPALIGTVFPPDSDASVIGGAWTGDRIFFTAPSAGLFEISALGGSPAEVLPRSPGEQDFHFASALPEQRGVLFVIHHMAGPDTIAVWRPGANRKILLQIPGANLKNPVFSPTGHILFQRHDQGRGIWAFAFSLDKLDRIGEPFRVSGEGSYPSVSNDGTLLFSLVRDDYYDRRRLTWVNRTGTLLDSFGRALPGLVQPSLSADGQRVVAVGGESVNELELWLFDTADAGVIRLTQNAQPDIFPSWWNARRILFTRRSESGNQVMAKSADPSGAELSLFQGIGWHLSRTGKYLILRQGLPGQKGTLGYMKMAEEPPKLAPFPASLQGISFAELSPDDQKLAYESAETETLEVYLVDFPGFTNRCQVSRGGGENLRWNPNGKELFYLAGDGRIMMSARLRSDGRGTDEPFKDFELPESVAGGASWPRTYDVAGDGERFLMMTKVREEAANLTARANVRVVLNWFEEFREKK